MNLKSDKNAATDCKNLNNTAEHNQGTTGKALQVNQNSKQATEIFNDKNTSTVQKNVVCDCHKTDDTGAKE